MSLASTALAAAVAAAIAAAFCTIGLKNIIAGQASSSAPKRQALLTGLGLSESESRGKVLVGFFHPYCNAGGGGERVLWAAVARLQRTEPKVITIIYTGDNDASKEEIIFKVKARFDIVLDPQTLAFVYVHSRSLIEDATWKRFTLLGQSLGSMVVGWEALGNVVPDIYIDTMGYAFTYPLLSLFFPRVPIGAYVHYPTISADMLERVKSRKAGHTNKGAVAGSVWKSWAKLIYYHIFALLYTLSLNQADEVVVNSSWTKSHIDTLHSSLRKSRKAAILYPPCDVQNLKAFPLPGRERVILSIAQFRPEKEHSVQVEALFRFLTSQPECKSGPQKVSLVLVGSSRNAEDAARVDKLRKLVREKGLENNVEFVVNAPYDVLTSWLARASVGISTMVDEHFGINIVEYMASGLIPLVHASGGPLKDIVIPLPSSNEPTGLRATDPDSYAEALKRVFVEMSEGELLDMRQRARTRAERFSTEEFEKGWVLMWEKLVRKTSL